jgi:hypothetical protein
VGLVRLAPVALGFAWLCTLAAACAGGQSGTETPASEPDAAVVTKGHAIDGGPRGVGVLQGPNDNARLATCECALSEHAVLLRATLQTTDPCALRARVATVLAPADATLQPGDVVGGTLAGDGTCLGLKLAQGDDVLLVYQRGTQDGEGCTEYGQCLKSQCANAGTTDATADGGACDARCKQDTRAACAAHADLAQLSGQLVVARYGDPLVFGDADAAAVTLPLADAPRLLDAQACNAWFMQHAPDAAQAAGPSAPQCTSAPAAH